jgi:tetratricopeptide (TPR) repeat protein
MSISPPQQSGEWYERALAYHRAGNYARAKDCAHQALATDPHHVPSLLLKGMALIELDQPEAAVAPLQQATSAAPDSSASRG